MADATDDLPTVRLGELVEALRVALGGGRGWQASVAELLGVTGPFVSRLKNPDDPLRVGTDVVKRIRKAHGIPEGFFSDPEHAQRAEVYAELIVPQVGLDLAGEGADHRRRVVGALTRLIAAAEAAREEVLEGLPVHQADAIGSNAAAVLLELGAYRERLCRG